MKYSIILVLALAAVAFAQEAPKRIEKRGIIGGIGLGYGLPLAAPIAPLAAPIAPIAPYGLGLGLGSPYLGHSLPLGYGFGGLPLGYGGLGYGGLGYAGLPALL